MAAILNSTMLDSDTAILDSDTFLSSLSFTPKHSPSTLTLTQTNSIWLTWWWSPSWILPSWILPSWNQPFCTKLWLKLIQSDCNSFILTQLDDGSHLEFYYVGFRHCHLGFRHLSYLPLRFTHTCQHWFPPLCTLKTLQTNSYLIQLDDGSHLEFSHLEFCHLVFFSQIQLKNTLTALWLWLKLIQSDSNLFILTQLDDGSHLEFYHLEFRHCHLGFRYHLSFSSQTHSHLSRLVPTTMTQKTFKLIHSDSTWWWQQSWILPSWILPSWIQPFAQNSAQTHSFWINLMMSAILNSAMLDSDTLFSSTSDFPLKNTLTCQDLVPTIWLKLIQSDSNSFILTQIDDGSHLEFYHVGFRHCHLGFRHLLIFSQIHSKTALPPLWLWLKLIQSDSNSFILTELEDGQPSWILPWWILTSLFSSLRITQKHSQLHSDSDSN